MKKALTILLVIVLLLQATPLSALAAGPLPTTGESAEKIAKNGEAVPQTVREPEETEDGEKTAEADPVRLTASGTVSGRSSVAKPTMGELRQMLDAIPTISKLYATAPVVSGTGYRTATLSSQAYGNALGWINYYRTAAGLGKVSFTDELNLSAAWGALCLAMGEQFTHYPEQPADMSDEDYRKGYAATSSSNISWSMGYPESEVLRVAVAGQIGDADSGNIRVVGHRRWLLDPRILTMGVGTADSDGYYTDVRVIGNGVSTQNVTDYDVISWPASGDNISETFPYNTPWSITLNPSRFTTPSLSKVKVTLTRNSDGKKWNFSNGTDTSTVGEEYDYFTVETGGYGVANCIIFRPACSGFSAYEGEYTVDVTGIFDSAGKETSLHYSVRFEPYLAPEFKVQNLVLSGQIGVNFFLDLDSLTEEEREASYMEFSISGKGATTTIDPFDPNHKNASGKYYGFTCYVQSIQMADTITATYHYGNRQTVSKTYSVEEYFKTFDQHAAENPKKTVDLVHAIADYGHYMQLYLASVNGFTLGTDYAELTRHYTESYDWADILSKVEEHAIARTYGTSKVEKANYRLQLGSETTLDVFLKTTDGSAPTDVTVTIREEVTGTTTTKAYTPEKQADGRYLVTIPNISAHKLGDKVTVTGNAGGSFTVVVSPLSFVRDVLKNETKTESLNGLSSLYAYYMAAIAYKQQ